MRRRGRKVDPARVMFWEVMGTLRWGIMCCGMMQRFRNGPDHSMERAMIGRRSSETEIDLLRLLAPDGGKVRMQDEPTPTELIKAVADFLRNEIAPRSTGHNAFKLRVGDQRARSGDAATDAGRRSDAAEAAPADAVARREGSLDRTQPRAGRADREAARPISQTPGLAEHLWQTTMDKLAVDQPNYASYKRELGE